MPSRFVNREGATEAGETVGFSFGENWAKYLDGLTEAKLAQATESLESAFASRGIRGRDFLDLGSGSGLFSYAAQVLGARSVMSVDIDPTSVACASYLKSRAGDPDTWTVIRGSVLDARFVDALEPVDRLYSWGVLHHTGAMWVALGEALKLVAPGGLACIGLYNPPRNPGLHLTLKRTYNRLPRPLRPVMTTAYALAYTIRLALTRRNPVTYVRNYGARNRGMSFRRDIEDWLGGLPYEFAEVEEVRTRVARQGFKVVRSVVRSPGNVNEYLIERPP